MLACSMGLAHAVPWVPDNFASGGGTDLESMVMVKDASNQLLVGGAFTTVEGQAGYQGVARFKTDDTLDTAFKVKTNQFVRAIAVQPDGKILIGGAFTKVVTSDTPTGTAIWGIARLNPDGTLDPNFKNAPTGKVKANDHVNGIVLQPDGKIVIAGSFTQIDGVARSGIARLKANGTPDPDFDTSNGANNWVWAVLPDGNDKLYIGGKFTSAGGIARRGIARLTAQQDQVTTLSGACWNKNAADVRVSSVNWPSSNLAMPLDKVPFEADYVNDVSASSDIPFGSGNLNRWSGSEGFSAPMAGLSGKSLNYLDQHIAQNKVTYTFATPLTQDEAMLVLDVDGQEHTSITFYDESDNPITSDRITAVQIRGSNGAPALAIDATSTMFTLTGSGVDNDNPTWAFAPFGAQKVKKVVVDQGTSDVGGSWDVTFVHAACDAAPALADMQATAPATVSVTVGTPVSLTSTCTNNGLDAAANATCTVTGAPADATTTCTPATPVGTLASGSAITCTTKFTPQTAAPITLTTTAGSETPDPNTDNDTASTSVSVGLQPAPVPTLGPWALGLLAGLLGLMGFRRRGGAQ